MCKVNKLSKLVNYFVTKVLHNIAIVILINDIPVGLSNGFVVTNFGVRKFRKRLISCLSFSVGMYCNNNE